MAEEVNGYYTKTPNVWFDEIMPKIKSLAEMKVVSYFVRETIGWHRKNKKASYTEIMKGTGLSRQGAFVGVANAIDDGFLIREPHGQSYTYSLNEVFYNIERSRKGSYNVERFSDLPFNDLEQSDGDSSSPPATESPPLKKGLKERKVATSKVATTFRKKEEKEETAPLCSASKTKLRSAVSKEEKRKQEIARADDDDPLRSTFYRLRKSYSMMEIEEAIEEVEGKFERGDGVTATFWDLTGYLRDHFGEGSNGDKKVTEEEIRDLIGDLRRRMSAEVVRKCQDAL